MDTDDFRSYVERLGTDLERKYDPTPELSGRPALQALLEQAIKDGSRTLKVTAEPKRTTIGSPDFVIKTSAGLNVGHIETKAPRGWRELERELASEQLQRYREQLPNLLLTDYVHAILLRDGKEIGRASLLTTFQPGGTNRVRDEDATHFDSLLATFLSHDPEPVKTPERLATLLARYAALVRVAMEDELRGENSDGPLHTLLVYFDRYLHPGANNEIFADAIAQSVVYALLVARMNLGNDENLEISNTPKMLPESLGFLSSFVELVQETAALATVEWALREACDVLMTVPQSVLDKAGQVSSGTRHDPVIYFYEQFLQVYDRDARMDRGVYYTPIPLVGFITRAVDQVLREQFSLDRGLADQHVTLLDPACGTGTFLVAAAGQALDTVAREDGVRMVPSAIERHVLKHFVGFELQACPYTIAHIKMTGYLSERSRAAGKKLAATIRPRIYLSNTLAPAGQTMVGDGATLPIIREVVQEGLHANAVKQNERILVIVGNPPYKRETYNRNPFIDQLLDAFFKVDGVEIPDRNTTPLQSDELRFLRWSVWKLMETENSQGHGIVAFVTNHAFIRRKLHRGVRKFLFDRFDEIHIFDLHGNRRAAYADQHDENVFPPVMQGICICVLVRRPQEGIKSIHSTVYYRQKIGRRDDKFTELEGATLYDEDAWTKHTPVSPNYSFVPRSEAGPEYEEWPRVTDLFIVKNSGLITGADNLLVAFSADELETRMKRFLGNRLDKSTAAEIFDVDVSKPRSWLNTIDHKRRASRFNTQDVVEWTYRPGDQRYVYLAQGLLKEYRKNVTPSARQENVVLAIASGGSPEAPYAWASRGPMPQAVLSSRTHGRAGLFPARIYPEGSLDMFGPADNVSRTCRETLMREHKRVPDGRTLCNYVYAVLWSNWWRGSCGQRAYEDDDFPRVPVAAAADDFESLAKLGGDLIDLHTMKAGKVVPLQLGGTGEPRVGKWSYDELARVINVGECHLGPIELSDVAFTVGGYPVLRQWFEAREGLSVGVDELEHLRRLLWMIRRTPEVIERIDAQLEACEKGEGFITWESGDGGSPTDIFQYFLRKEKATAKTAPVGKPKLAKRRTPTRKR